MEPEPDHAGVLKEAVIFLFSDQLVTDHVVQPIFRQIQ